jgi:hypothetical protein
LPLHSLTALAEHSFLPLYLCLSLPEHYGTALSLSLDEESERGHRAKAKPSKEELARNPLCTPSWLRPVLLTTAVLILLLTLPGTPAATAIVKVPRTTAKKKLS